MKKNSVKSLAIFLVFVMMLCVFIVSAGCQVTKQVEGRWKNDEYDYILYIEEDDDNISYELHGYRESLIVKGTGTIGEEIPEGWNHSRTYITIKSVYFDWKLACSENDEGEIYRLYGSGLEFYRDN